VFIKYRYILKQNSLKILTTLNRLNGLIKGLDNTCHRHLIGVLIMGKFPEADAELKKIWICKKCKARNKAGVKKCRKCGYRYLRPKKKDTKKK